MIIGENAFFKKIVMCSGGFDPLHIGHIRYLEAAAKLGDIVVVALNSDEWLIRKKGYVFMPWDDRAEVLRALACVWGVVSFNDDDGTAGWALRLINPKIYANGGDRAEAVPYENSICEELGIEQIFGVGGEKIVSSSGLVVTAAGNMKQWAKACLDHYQNTLQG